MKERAHAEPDRATASHRPSWPQGSFFAAGPRNSGPAISPPFFQTKLQVGEPGDRFEREANRVADQVTVQGTAPPIQTMCAGCAEETEDKKLRRQPDGAGQPAGTGSSAPSLEQHLSSSRGNGRPLPPSLEQSMSAAFGRDFSSVRVHTGEPATQLNRDLTAEAFTHGNHIYFNEGNFAPDSAAGRRLLAHELTHVVQQGFSGADVQRQPAAPSTLPPLPPTKTYKERWQEFEQLRLAHKDAEALALAPSLVSSLGLDESIQYGGELMLWLTGKGEWDLARRALKSIENAWWIRFVTIHGTLPTTAGWGARSSVLGPDKLSEQAELQAAAGEHARARELFATAFLFLQMQLTTYTDERLKKLAEVSQQEEHLKMSGSFGILLGLLRYQEPESIYASMRRILSFYPAQQRQALVAGDAAKAKQMEDLDKELRSHVKASHSLLTGESEGLRGITLEGTLGKDKKRGEGYTLHGTNQVEEFVTPLPGTPRPDELGRYPAYTSSMEDLFKALTGQEDFLTGIFAHPEVRKEFKDRPPTVEQMSDMDVRLRLWRALLQAYQKQPAAGCPTALCSLLRMVELYLRHFTAHTEYDVDDFGPSYIGHNMPTDLAGRALRDCGVYAITTAYEVFRAVQGAKPKIDASFQLVQTLEHVMLVIRDKGTGTHYVVNNNQILGPKEGDPFGTVATAYADVMGYKNVLSAAVNTPELTSSLTDATFRKKIRDNFQAGARFDIDVPPGKTEEETIKGYYDLLRSFDRLGTMLHARLDELAGKLSGANRVQDMTSALPDLTNNGQGMAAILDAFARNTIRVGFVKPPPVPGQQRVLTTAGREGDHPLVRVCMALLHAEKIGIKLDAGQQKLLDVVRKIPGATFDARLIDYDKAGRPARF